jgi:hypothetical protein
MFEDIREEGIEAIGACMEDQSGEDARQETRMVIM